MTTTTTTSELLNQARTVQARYRSSDLDIAELIGRLADELELLGDRHEPVQLECLDHEPVQRRDGKTPWCRVCGLDAAGNEPVSRLGRHAREEPDAATERVTGNSVRHVKQLTTELQNKRESLNDQRREFRKLLADARAERDAALAVLGRVRKYADERSVYGRNKNNVVSSWRIASDLHELLNVPHEEQEALAEAERDATLAAIERVRAVHVRDTPSIGGDWCLDDHHNWPCPTISALDGAPEPEDGVE